MGAPRLTEAQREAILAAYEAGAKALSIAEYYGVDRSYPGLLAKRRGRKLRLTAAARANMADGAKTRRSIE